MNTYSKYCPNVYLAKCEDHHDKGENIQVSTKYGKENDCIVFNLIYEKDGFFYYSIVRADGFNHQEWAKKRADRLRGVSLNAEKKSDQYYDASHEGKDFLSLGEPIKVGHHSEKRHRALIERNHNRMGKSIEYKKKAESYESRAAYWEQRATTINLSMPESIEYFEFKLEQTTIKHEAMKAGTVERRHSMALSYAKRDVNEAKKSLEIAKRLWSENIMMQEQSEAADKQAHADHVMETLEDR